MDYVGKVGYLSIGVPIHAASPGKSNFADMSFTLRKLVFNGFVEGTFTTKYRCGNLG